jgi:HSP20 family protein
MSLTPFVTTYPGTLGWMAEPSWAVDTPRRMLDEMNKMMTTPFGGENLLDTALAQQKQILAPMKNILKVDLAESRKDFHIIADLPGMRKEDIQVAVEGDFLVLRGERTQAKDEQGFRTRHVEREYGKVERFIRIPSNADYKKIDASYENGVLRVTMPKLEPSAAESSTTTIPIK